MTLNPMIAATSTTTPPAIAIFFQFFIDPRPRGLLVPSSGRSVPHGAPARCTYIRCKTVESFIGKQLIPSFSRMIASGGRAWAAQPYLAMRAHCGKTADFRMFIPAMDYTRNSTFKP
jgi:hypothetical protein